MRILHSLALIAAFLGCYLEWGDRSAFLFQMVPDIFSRSRVSENISHPAILLPLAGLLLLLAYAFARRPPDWMIWAGLILPALLVLFILLIGLMSGNWRIALSTIPFVLTTVTFIVRERRTKTATSSAEKATAR